MRKLVLSISLGLILLFSVSLMANVGESPTAIPAEDIQEIVSSGTRAPCEMAKHNGVPYYLFDWFKTGDGIYTYFNPEVECGWPTYPFAITDVSFTLFDGYGLNDWPVSLDFVVYDLLTAGDSCSGPGTELCRYSITADEAHYAYPIMGTHNFPPGGRCFIDGPAFIGLEYTSGAAGSTPSICCDTVRPDICDQWMLYNGTLYEWRSKVALAGYIVFTVGGKTTCTWGLDDEYKMHYPQLPNPAGWDVIATYPINLADDWLCTETGWVRDIHWWGAWLDNNEVPIDYFWLSIHEDIPANPPAQPFSMPGASLWEMYVFPGDFEIHSPPYGYEPAGWFDPWQMLILPENHDMFWQYDLCLDGTNRFWQEEGTIYWLCITAGVSDPSAVWGWRSTLDHWNDDAVIAEYPIWDFYELWEPPDFMTSLDLAFVITGGPPDTGACCYQNLPSSDRLCIETTVDSCLDFYNGTFLGPGWPCDGSLEACCLLDGLCVMADVNCCMDEFGGMPQGPGSVCTAPEACCLGYDGSCLMCDPMCCDEEGGVPQGAGTVCTEPEACCLNNGDCIMIDPLCCDEQGGVPQGVGTVCTEPEACCLDNGDCIVVDPLCCIDQNGTPLGPGTGCSGLIVACCLPSGGCMDVDLFCCIDMGGFISPYSGVCLGDANYNNVNDACEEPFGACCLDDGSCQLLTQTDCEAITGATYLGDGTICLGDSDDDGNDDACVDPWPNHKMHFPQLPDPSGWDVMSVATRILADDWKCTESGPIASIHWWGSWLDDNIGTVDYFVLGIFIDIPADPPQIPYSRPGIELWEYVADDFDVTAYDPPTLEGWYDPGQGLVLPDNHQSYFRYDVSLPEQMWFPQDSGTIYWLAISAVDVGPTGSEQWGWKSSRNHWNDDAVWGEWLILDWIDIWEPPDFEVSLDLAFVIAGELPCDGICGDANGDGTVNVSDAVRIINYVFAGGGEPQPVLACGDANNDGIVNVSDAVRIINYVFAGGGPPGDCSPGSPNWYNGDCCPFVPPPNVK